RRLCGERGAAGQSRSVRHSATGGALHSKDRGVVFECGRAASRCSPRRLALEADEAGGELDLARAAHGGGRRGEERQASAEDRRRDVAVPAEAIGAEHFVAVVGEIEDVKEKIEVAAASGQGEILDEAQIEIVHRGLPERVASGDLTVEDGAV